MPIRPGLCHAVAYSPEADFDSETVLLPEDDPKTAEILAKIKYEAREGGPATLTHDTATATPEQFDLRTAKAPVEASTEANGGVNVAPGPSSSGAGDSALAPSSAPGDTGLSTPSPALASADVSAPSTVNKVKGKAPARRKLRQSLESMSAALDKGKKMTTLEKVSPLSRQSVRLFGWS